MPVFQPLLRYLMTLPDRSECFRCVVLRVCRSTVIGYLSTIFCILGPPIGLSAEPNSVDFSLDIRPILSNVCFHCHGPDEGNRAADLRLDQEEAAKEYAIVAGDLKASELIRRITSDDPYERMPPRNQKQQLSSDQIELLKNWVSEGAPWAQHWAFIPPTPESFPQVQDSTWPKVGIDYFVLSRVEKNGLAPSSRATPETLIRRASLDLTGLPPTLAEVDAFLADDSPNAFEHVVDRLLDSPRYGEHMALPWLAAARYADTNGYQSDATRTMWPWRDWVIRAMNDNLPFDQFTIHQLAGDLLDNPTQDQLIATGFHRNHALNGEGGRNAEESRVEYVIDRADTTGTVWMGLTVGCARCHDHKYDAVSQKEFYQLYAYFNAIDESGGVDAGGNAKPVLALPTDEQKAEIDALRTEITVAEQGISELPAATELEIQLWYEQTLQWLKLAEQGKLWTHLHQVKLECESGATWSQLKDGSVLVTEMPDSGDDYLVTVKLPEGIHRALRIEALKHSQLVDGLFSHGLKGAFAVTDLEVLLDGVPIPLVEAQTNVGGQRGADGLLDKNKYTVWSLSNPRKAPEVPTWLAKFASPLEVDSSSILTVRMLHKSRTGEAPIGRFRLSTTAHPSPTIQPKLGLPNDVVAAIRKPVDQWTADDRHNILGRQLQLAREAPLRNQIEELQAKIRAVESKQLYTMVMRERKKPRDTFRLVRGLWNNPDKSEKLHPEVLACLPSLPADAPRNRLTLALWLTSPDHPLMARVTVNRYWQHFFGIGLVKTSEDFGVQGDPPSHPKLLDWLATEFTRSGWNVKQLHKLIVMSAAYQQASQVTSELIRQDPYNRLLTRGPRFRLSAQALRDQALALSGLLVEKIGGPGVHPYQPANVWYDFSLGKIRYKQGKGDDLYRRSIYTFWRRSVGPTLFFDSKARQLCTVRPSLTNTPLHALTLLNDVTYVEAARVLAQRVMTEADSPVDRIRLAFRIATARRASDEELECLSSAFEALIERFRNDVDGASTLIAIGEYPREKTINTVELAAYTSLMNVILNLDEVVTKG